MLLSEFPSLAGLVGPWAIAPDHFGFVREQVTNIKGYLAAAPHMRPWASTMEKVELGEGKHIAIVQLTGVLAKFRPWFGGSSTIQARRDLAKAARDKSVGGIVLAIDSPGGTVSGTYDLAEDVKAARKQKPVVAHIDDLGASAAYWAAVSAEKITANSETALVGSIGTIQVMMDTSAAAEKEGIQTHVFATGRLKGLGTPGSRITDEQQEHVQGLVNAVQESFDDAVMTGRRMSAQQLADVRHGGVLTAPEARKKGLIDGVQSLAVTIGNLSRAIPPARRGGDMLANNLLSRRRRLADLADRKKGIERELHNLSVAVASRKIGYNAEVWRPRVMSLKSQLAGIQCALAEGGT